MKPGEGDHRAARAEGRIACRPPSSAPSSIETVWPARVLHLRRDRPLEDQVVERELVAAQLARELGGRAEHVAGGPDRLVRLLGVRDRALVAPRLVRNRLRAVLARGMRARRLERGVGERHGVGAHVGDVAVLVEALGEAHRRLGREAQLPARLLLERRGPERRRGPARVRLLVDLADAERPALERRPRARGRAPRRARGRRRPGVPSSPKSRPCATRARRRRRRAAPRTTRARTCRATSQ